MNKAKIQQPYKQGNGRRGTSPLLTQLRRWASTLIVVLFGTTLLTVEAVLRAHEEEVRFIPVDTVAVANTQPTLASSDDGNHVVVAWAGYVAGKRRIVFRERIFGEWLAEQLLDEDAGCDNFAPQIAIDRFGCVYVAWISRLPDSDIINIVSRRAEQWSTPQRLSVPNSTKMRFEDLTLALREPPVSTSPEIWLCWQGSAGNTFSIWAARLRGGSAGPELWDVAAPLSKATYNLAPQMLPFADQMAIVWLTTIDSEFLPVVASFAPESGRWEIQGHSPLATLLPTERFPQLLAGPQDKTLATWSEPSEVGDKVEAALYPTPWGDSEETSPTQPIPIYASNLSPGYILTTQAATYVPQSQTLVVGLGGKAAAPTTHSSLIQVAVARVQETAQAPNTFSLAATSCPTSLALAVPTKAGNKITIVYASDQDYGGDGHVYIGDLSLSR